jgi:type IV pilus assembly protein PilW
MNMVELMVAMTIGLALIVGATQVYVNSRKSYGDNESVTRLQETARYAMAVIEPDIRMANFWGQVKDSSVVAGGATQLVAPGLVAAGAGAIVCGNNFAIDIRTNIEGTNNQYFQQPTRQAGCDALVDLDNAPAVWNSVPVVTADTLTVRRASVLVQGAAGPAGTVQVCSTLFAASLFSDGASCNPASSRVNNLIVNAYYVDRNSSLGAGVPALRRKVLTMAGGVPVFRDQEIIAGIEDMQIQFGIETGTPRTGVATRYVNPGAAVPANAQIVAVRIWLLVASDQPESGFTDSRQYEYADRQAANGATGDLNALAGVLMAYQPSASADATFVGPQHRRRLLVSRTIQIRNAVGT